MQKPKGIISAIERYALHDGDGIRTMVFFQGCPLRCRWCANPETQDANAVIMFDAERCIACGKCQSVCPHGAWHENKLQHDKCRLCEACINVCPNKALRVSAVEMSVDEIMAEILRDEMFYRHSGGGVTLSGGEVLMQHQFAAAILQQCKENYINTAIETSGFAEWSRINELVPYIDTFLYDIKFFSNALHRKWTGVSNDLIIANLRQLCQVHQNIIIRIPVIPTINDSHEELNHICQLAIDCSIKEVHLLPYHKLAMNKYQQLDRDYEMPDLPSLPVETLLTYKDIFSNRDITCNIGG